MFALHSITLTNFRSYIGTHEFEFPDRDGLYFLSGENKANPALGANGAGKSTFLDAVTWVLFGCTTRGLKANEVLSWGSTSAAVTLELSIGKQRFQVQRAQKPNGLFLDGKVVDQKELETSIRLNFESFIYSVLHPQFTSPFFALTASAKLILFSDIMGLNFWIEKSDEASKLAKKISSQIIEQESAINRYDGQQVSIREDILDLKHDEANYFDQRDVEILEIKKQSKAVWESKNRIEDSLNASIDKRSRSNPVIKAAAERVTSLTEQRDTYLETIDKLVKEKVRYTDLREHFHTQFRKLDKSPDTCPTCGQNVDAKHLQRELALIGSKIEKCEKHVAASIEATKRNVTSMIKVKLELESVEANAHDLRNEASKLDVKITLKRDELKNIGPQLDELGLKLKNLQKKENPYSVLLDSKRDKLLTVRKNLANAQEKRFQLETEYEAVSFWVKGFKRVRLFIIEQAFKTLEIEVNNSLAQLGMTDWQITFDIERENKSGGITKGFVVFVKSPANSEPVKWESWSGGETQRLQLAGDLGLANLIMQQLGLSNTVEFYDEPSTHLSQEGMMDLADMLHDRAVSEGKRIWIIDHTSITNFGEFEGKIKARKDENGSRITIEDSA